MLLLLKNDSIDRMTKLFSILFNLILTIFSVCLLTLFTIVLVLAALYLFDQQVCGVETSITCMDIKTSIKGQTPMVCAKVDRCGNKKMFKYEKLSIEGEA